MAWTTYPTVSDGTPTHNARALTDAEAANFVGVNLADLNEGSANVPNQCDAKYKVWPMMALLLWIKNKLITLVNAAGGFVQLDGAGKLPAVDGSELTNLVPDSGFVTLDVITGIATIATAKVHLTAGSLTSIIAVTYAGGAATPVIPVFVPNAGVVDVTSFDIHGDAGARVCWAVLKE